MTYGYIRVSSDKQTVENQRFEMNYLGSRSEVVHFFFFLFAVCLCENRPHNSYYTVPS